MQNTDYHSKEYWNERCLEGQQKNMMKEMIMEDRRFDAYEDLTRKTLSQWKDLGVLDIACGYGRFSDIFTNYHGVDFSEEMIKLAKKLHPDKDFSLTDSKGFSYDVIFEVNSLKCLGLTPEQFYEFYKSRARVAVACLELDKFTIFHIYDGEHS